MRSDPAKMLADYTVVERLGETHQSAVYRARKGRQKTVIIKVIRIRNPSAAEIARFRHEYELIRRIEIEGIVRPLDFFEYEGRPALVMEDFGGVSLKEILAAGFALERFLELAIRLAEILGQLHENNISHRDINPHNILINPATDTLKITDFGIATEIAHTYEELSNPSMIEGTLAYLSPEQTGRMNCGVDYRTDLYSLGVTFYEMLTGTVPFRSEDPLEIIHSHIARLPIPPCEKNPDVPRPVSEIVMKLLAKSAAERYQNGFGLAADLRECLRRQQEAGRIDPFALGARDISLRFIIPQHVVGREEELGRLYAAFERAGRGAVEVILVTGEPGIGKSALVNEIHKPIAARRGYFITGKFDQFHRAIPYSAIIQAFQSLARQLLAESDPRLAAWKDRLLAALGRNGRIITEVIPEIELIIGRQPPVPELEPEETQNRFSLFFKSFVRVFARESHPLVLFLDDLQWADRASLDLIQTIATDRNLRYFLLVGTYRDADVAAHHPFMLARDAIQAAGVPIHTLPLGTLGPDGINRMLASFLHCPPAACRSLAEAVHAKTKGSPFFINQFLKILYDQRHLRLDPAHGWTWDLEGVREIEATENVVAFMADKLHDQPAAALELIRVCACIGNHFDLETLVMITDRSTGEILALLDGLIQEGLISRTGDAYRFYHDRIQEAAYSLLSPEERERLHYRIGRWNLEHTPAEQLSGRIFYICDQLNQAGSRLSGRAERIRLAELNLKAGIRAKESAAYAAAVSYLSAGSRLLAADAWHTDYSLAHSLFIELMECQYLDRNFEEAERLFQIITANSATRCDCAKAYYIMVVLYTNLRTPEDAIDMGLKGLALFGIRLSPKVGVPAVLVELIRLKRRIGKIGVEKMADLPLTEDADLNACLQLLFAVGMPAYYVNQNLFAKLVLKGINMGLRHGVTMRHVSAAQIAMATIIQAALGDYALGYRLGEVALKTNERFDDRKTAGIIHHLFAFFIQHWKRHARHNLDFYRKACQLSLNAGNFTYAGHSVNAATDCRLMIGVRLDEALAENNQYGDLMHLVKDPFIAARHQENNQLILNLQGRTESRYRLSGPGYDEAAHLAHLEKEKNAFGLCYTLLYRLKIDYLYGRFEAARRTAARLDRHIKVQLGTQLMAEHYFYYSLVLTALILNRHQKPVRFRRTIARNQHRMRKWARLCPANFGHKHDLVAAEMMAIKGRHREALKHYHRAIDGARHSAYLHEEALACERLALFYRDGGAGSEAAMYMQRACRCYASWGAQAKVDELGERHPDLIGPEKTTAPPERGGGTTSTESTSENLDLATVMRVSQVISSEIMLDRLLQKAMHMFIANAGAQRGCLILESDGRLLVQASEDVKTGEKRVLQGIGLEACEALSPAIVHYVHHSGEPLILGNAGSEGAFTQDPHVLRNRCQSILCMPILNKGKLAGILYMENNLTAEAFTPERLEILGVIAAQAAISLQNASLYEEITSEITVRKQAEEAMRASESKYRIILEEMQDAYCETDLEGTITFTNPSACALTGFSSSELAGANIRRLLLTDQTDIDAYFRAIRETGRPGKPFDCQCTARDGRRIELEIVASPIRDPAGRVIGFRNVGRDVGERKRLEKDLLESDKNVQKARAATILGLAKLAEYRDEDTGAHLERIREYARIIARELAGRPEYGNYITEDYIEDIYNSAILHDIGKVGVPDAILRKPGRLTPEEFEIIKTHSTLGGDALREVESKTEGQTFLTLGKEIAYYHHEKWDGSGYPKGLKGEEIPLSARIVALADVYDALTSERTYKEAFSHQKAVEIITHDRGTHFAPDVVDAFLAHAEDFRRIREEVLGG